MKASEIVKKRLNASKGEAEIQSLTGKKILVSKYDAYSFVCDKLPNTLFAFDIFDIVVDFIKKQGGKARKGNGRGTIRVGDKNCEKDTIMYEIATKYYGKAKGEACTDPVYIIAAIMEWAGIARNKLGYVELI